MHEVHRLVGPTHKSINEETFLRREREIIFGDQSTTSICSQNIILLFSYQKLLNKDFSLLENNRDNPTVLGL